MFFKIEKRIKNIKFKLVFETTINTVPSFDSISLF